MTYDIELKTNDGWLIIESLKQVKRGDTFRIWVDTPVYLEEDGSPKEFVAQSSPYFSEKFKKWVVPIVD